MTSNLAFSSPMPNHIFLEKCSHIEDSRKHHENTKITSTADVGLNLSLHDIFLALYVL